MVLFLKRSFRIYKNFRFERFILFAPEMLILSVIFCEANNPKARNADFVVDLLRSYRQKSSISFHE